MTDTTAPSITSAAGPEATETTYTSTNTVAITATFDEEVRVLGTPTLNLQIGGPTGTTGTAVFSGTNDNLNITHTFTYTVGDSDNGAVVITSVIWAQGGVFEIMMPLPAIYSPAILVLR